jgi:hypothetical protein
MEQGSFEPYLDIAAMKDQNQPYPTPPQSPPAALLAATIQGPEGSEPIESFDPDGWRANKQNTVITSTTEAELLSLSQGAKEGQYIKRLLDELSVSLDEQRILAASRG